MKNRIKDFEDLSRLLSPEMIRAAIRAITLACHLERVSPINLACQNIAQTALDFVYSRNRATRTIRNPPDDGL